MSPSISPLIVRRDRYDVSGLVEAQFEPGSRGRVLRNLLGIARKREMDRAEAEAQLLAFDRFSSYFMADHRFTAADIVGMHRVWLGGIYQWAGKFRQVQVSKSGFLFAAPTQIPRLMAELETGPLRKHTPCLHASRERVIEGLADVHVELVLFHPFRDGNGRLARMLAVLMGLQAALPPLDFSGIKGRERQVYFNAVRRGLDRDYQPMQQVFEKVIEKTLLGFRKRAASSARISPRSGTA